MNDSEIARQLERARGGDRSAVGALFEGHRVRLERLVALRLDRRLRARVDEADVVQDTFLEAARRIEGYLERPSMPFYLWLRFLANQRLQTLCREHLGARRRDVRREVPIAAGPYPEASSEALAAQLLGKLTTPSQVAMRAEMNTQALESMDTEIGRSSRSGTSRSSATRRLRKYWASRRAASKRHPGDHAPQGDSRPRLRRRNSMEIRDGMKDGTRDVNSAVPDGNGRIDVDLWPRVPSRHRQGSGHDREYASGARPGGEIHAVFPTLFRRGPGSRWVNRRPAPRRLPARPARPARRRGRRRRRRQAAGNPAAGLQQVGGTASGARSGAAWASSTRRSRSPSGGAWP